MRRSKGLAAGSQPMHLGTAMTTFEKMHASRIEGKLVAIDRLIIKGHLLGLMPKGAFARFLALQGVLLVAFAVYVKTMTDRLKKHAMRFAEKAGRPYEYLAGAFTARRGQSKEDRARAIVERDGIVSGLVAVFATVEPCTSFQVVGNRETHKLEVVRQARKCLFFYFYFMDRDFGLMHVRLQSWFPFGIQVYVNGREWLCRQLDRRNIGYERHDNAIVRVDDLAEAQRLADNFARRDWVRVLDAMAHRVNPLLAVIKAAGFGGYHWVADQCEVATDVLFKSRAALDELMPELFEKVLLSFGAEDVLRFLGRKLHPALTAEVKTDHKRRPEGRRVKHWLGRNSIKMYDKWSVLRIETTINQPRDFKILRVIENNGETRQEWRPMGKGIANLYRFVEVASASNQRYLDALGNLVTSTTQAEAVRALDSLSTPHDVKGRHVPRLQPISRDNCALFEAVLRGEHAINGFRNKDVAQHLHPSPPSSPEEARRRTAKISRQLAKLRGHGLIAKVPRSHRYRITNRGHQLMSASIRVRHRDFPEQLAKAA